MSSKLIYVPLPVATRAEDGPALAHRTWVVHPEKGIAFRLEIDAEGGTQLVPLCVTHPRKAERLAREVGPDHDTHFVPAVFLHHVEALRPKPRLAPVPVPPRVPAPTQAVVPFRKSRLHTARLARMRKLAA